MDLPVSVSYQVSHLIEVSIRKIQTNIDINLINLINQISLLVFIHTASDKSRKLVTNVHRLAILLVNIGPGLHLDVEMRTIFACVQSINH